MRTAIILAVAALAATTVSASAAPPGKGDVASTKSDIRDARGTPRVLSGLPILKAAPVKPVEPLPTAVDLRAKTVGDALNKRIKDFGTTVYQPVVGPSFTISTRNPVGPHGISLIGRGPIFDYYPYLPQQGDIRPRTNLIPDANGNRVESPASISVMFPFYQTPPGYYLLDFTVEVVDTASSPDCRWYLWAWQTGSVQTFPCVSAPNNAYKTQHLLVAMEIPVAPPGLPNHAHHMVLENQRNDKSTLWKFVAVTIAQVQ